MMKEHENKSEPFTERALSSGVKISLRAGQDKKAEDIIVMDLSAMSSFTDIFIIMNGNSDRQNKAISRGIEDELKRADIRPISIVGKESSDWILMDYGSFIIHIFSKKAREYYALERLWGDCPKLHF